MRSSRLSGVAARSRFAPALAALVVLSLAAACSGTTTADPGSPTTTAAPTASPSSPTSTPPSSTATSEYADYVSLGDSYTAAPFVPETDTSNACLRSTGNYPTLVAAGMPGTALTDVSCGGADSTSMIGVQQVGGQEAPAQFDALDESVDLVTVGLGGNDFGIFNKLVGVCSQLGADDPTGTPCQDKFTKSGKDRLLADTKKVAGLVNAVATGVADRAPDARVVVVGYPQLIPDSGTCRDLLPLAAGDYPYARSVGKALDRAVRTGARRAGAEFLDVYPASAGHDICADKPWVNGAQTDTSAALAFHPFAVEQQAVADLLLGLLADPETSDS